jgi:hypothetical protein
MFHLLLDQYLVIYSSISQQQFQPKEDWDLVLMCIYFYLLNTTYTMPRITVGNMSSTCLKCCGNLQEERYSHPSLCYF